MYLNFLPSFPFSKTTFTLFIWDAVLQKRLARALFVLLLSLVCCQPIELILGFFINFPIFPPSPQEAHKCFIPPSSNVTTILITVEIFPSHLRTTTVVDDLFASAKELPSAIRVAIIMTIVLFVLFTMKQVCYKQSRATSRVVSWDDGWSGRICCSTRMDGCY